MLTPLPHHLGVVLPVLVHIETHLDGELSTGALAARAGLSPAHFHRVFAAVTGETVKQYTLRLRLERAAYRLLVERTTVTAVAVDAGFGSHETFTRAFRRRFGVAPSAYRATGPLGAAQVERRPGVEERLHGYELSETGPRELRATHVAFLRHVGPYDQVDGGAWAALRIWADGRGLPPGQMFGIGHDAPGVTEPQRLRFDACLEVPGPVRPGGRVGYQLIEGGHFAVTTHVGPFRTLGSAYDRIFERAARLRGYRLVGLPAVELYRCTVLNDAGALNSTEVRLPLERLAGP
jgi:AraC family transcriptional regulator